MNEKTHFRIVVILAVVSFLLGIAAGFFLGRGNTVGSAGLESANRELAATVGSLRAELDRERETTERLRSGAAEERDLITAALGACRLAGSGIQGVIAKMEILNGLIRELERRVSWDSDIPSGE